MLIRSSIFFLIFIMSDTFGEIVITSAPDHERFPEYFKFGVATAAFQIEGAWNESGKGENIWDRLTHSQPDVVFDHTNADVAANSYHFYEKDVDAMKFLDVDFYRFSISWSRVLPTGDISSLNEAGIKYYSDLVDLLLANGIEPMVTLYHWDLPQALQEIGGFTNPLIIRYFKEYASVLFARLGDRVKYWITFNEPTEQCLGGYVDKSQAPRLDAPGVGEYLCAHNVILSHAAAYHLYNAEFKDKYHGHIGITLVSNWFFTKTDSKDDSYAQNRALQFSLGWFAHPIFSATGGYPPSMVEVIDANSKKEGRAWSRLPQLTDNIKNHIKGTFDFLGLNHYTSRIISDITDPKVSAPSWYSDQNTTSYIDPSWKSSASAWLKVVPEGIRKLLQWVKQEYDNPLIFITENGFSDTGTLQDIDRANYICSYLNETLKAIIHDDCNVRGYTSWSLMDNYEWLRGYSEKFGLFKVNFDSHEKTRTAKLSAHVYKEIISTRRIPQSAMRHDSDL